MGFGRHFKAGQAATELAYSVPVLLLLLLAATDFARAFYFNQEVVAAARAGAQYGSQSVATVVDTSGISVAALANGTNVPGLAATSSVSPVNLRLPPGRPPAPLVLQSG